MSFYEVTADRRHSPQGRAGLVERMVASANWARRGYSWRARPPKDDTGQNYGWRVRNTMNKRYEYDFSHEVHEAMNGCLACKVCEPMSDRADVPSFRSRRNIYYSRYQRPAKDYLVANIETMLPLMAKAPKVVNAKQ